MSDNPLWAVYLDNGQLAVTGHTGYGLTVPLFRDEEVARRYAEEMSYRNPGSQHQAPIEYRVALVSVVPVEAKEAT